MRSKTNTLSTEGISHRAGDLVDTVIKRRTTSMLTSSLIRRTTIHELSVLARYKCSIIAFVSHIENMCGTCVCGCPLALGVTKKVRPVVLNVVYFYC